MAGRWRIFRSSIIALPENVEHFTRACLVLHNFLISKQTNYGCRYGDCFNDTGHLIDGGWRSDNAECALRNLTQLNRGFNFTNEAKAVRLLLTEWFLSPAGRVPWQDEAANYDGLV